MIKNAGAQRAVIINYISSDEVIVAESSQNGILKMYEEKQLPDHVKLPASIVNYVRNTGKHVLLNDASSSGQYMWDEHVRRNKAKSLLCLPVLNQNEIVGIIYLENNLTIGAFSEQRVKVLYLLSAQISISLKNAILYRHMERLVDQRTLQLKEKNEELQRLNNELLSISSTDSLTELYNRRKLDEELQRKFQEACRYDKTFSIILMDIDRFKEVNDRYGHHIGDKLLIELSNLLKSSVRSTDILGRWGGEEFMILCPGTDLDDAVHLAERIRSTIEKHNFSKAKHKTTGSFGVASYRKGKILTDIIKEADQCLYLSKNMGRNKVTKL